MANPDVPTVMRDPDFQGLPQGEQLKVLGKIDGDFAGLGQADQLRALTGLRQKFAAPKQPPAATPQPGFLSRLAQGVGIPTSMEGAGNALLGASGIGAVAQLGRGLYGAAKEGMGQAREAGQNIAAGGPVVPNVVKGAVMPAVNMGGAAAPLGAGNAVSMGGDIAQGNYRGAAGSAAATGVNAALLGAAGNAQAVEGVIPRRSHAAQAFADVAQKANNVQLDVSGPGNVALRIKELGDAGATMPKVVNKFLQRITNPESAPLTFKEARDFYTNASKLSASEAASLKGPMKFQVAQFARSLNDALTEAASSVDKGQQYSRAMREYAVASRNARWMSNAGKYFVKSLPYVGGAYMAHDAITGGK